MRNFPNPENICHEMLKVAGHQGPPTNLKVVCGLWPNIRVSEEELDKEGYLIPLGVHGALILVRKKDSVNRKKFTVAHELGHWVLGNLKAGRLTFGETSGGHLPIRTTHKRDTPEEKWCNEFASCLLMPEVDLHSYLRWQNDVGLANRIAQGHQVFRVSQEAFLMRIPEIMPISIFEVVSNGNVSKVRRSYLSTLREVGATEPIVSELLHSHAPMNDSHEAPIQIKDYEVQTQLIRRSQYGRSWLVSVTPIQNNNDVCNHEEVVSQPELR